MTAWSINRAARRIDRAAAEIYPMNGAKPEPGGCSGCDVIARRGARRGVCLVQADARGAPATPQITRCDRAPLAPPHVIRLTADLAHTVCDAPRDNAFLEWADHRRPDGRRRDSGRCRPERLPPLFLASRQIGGLFAPPPHGPVHSLRRHVAARPISRSPDSQTVLRDPLPQPALRFTRPFLVGAVGRAVCGYVKTTVLRRTRNVCSFQNNNNRRILGRQI